MPVAAATSSASARSRAWVRRSASQLCDLGAQWLQLAHRHFGLLLFVQQIHLDLVKARHQSTKLAFGFSGGPA